MTKDSIPYNPFSESSIRPDFYNNALEENDLTVYADSIASVESKEAEEVRYTGDKLPFTLSASDGLLIFFFLCFAVFTRIYKESFLYLREDLLHLFSFKERSINYKEITTKEVWFSYFLVSQTVALLAIILYDIFVEYVPNGDTIPPLLLIVVFAVLLFLFIGLKYLWYKVFGYVFDVGKTMQLIMQTGTSIFEILGIVLFIPTLLLIYLEYWHLYIIYSIIILFLIAQIIFFIKVVVYFVREKFSFLFLIAYLCTVEIIPYFILGMGLIYLYKKDLFNVIIL